MGKSMNPEFIDPMSVRHPRSRSQQTEEGFALLTSMFLLGLLSSSFGAYSLLTNTELALVKSSKDSQSGFNAAEAGLNLRAEEIRRIFIDYDKPEGESPAGILDCDNGVLGAGDYQCQTYTFGNGHS